MYELPLRIYEIDKLKKSLLKVEENNIKEENAYMLEIQKNFQVIKKLEKYSNESSTTQSLEEEKENIQLDIISTISNFFPLIEIIFEQEYLLEKVMQAIEDIKEQLANRPREDRKIIKALNSKMREELEEIVVEDRAYVVIEVKKL